MRETDRERERERSETDSLSWSATTTLSSFSALIFCVSVTTFPKPTRCDLAGILSAACTATAICHAIPSQKRHRKVAEGPPPTASHTLPKPATDSQRFYPWQERKALSIEKGQEPSVTGNGTRLSRSFWKS